MTKEEFKRFEVMCKSEYIPDKILALEMINNDPDVPDLWLRYLCNWTNKELMESIGMYDRWSEAVRVTLNKFDYGRGHEFNIDNPEHVV